MNAIQAQPPRVCEVAWLGRIEPLQAWALQEKLAEEIGRGLRPPRLLLLEHPPIYTFGRMGKAEHLLWGESELKQRGIQVYWTDRGGDVTYHGPGQLVGYPLLPLGAIELQSTGESSQPPRADYRGYLRQLEQVLVRALTALGYRAYPIPGRTGVWITPPGRSQAAKVAAIGVKVDARGVTRHGFAINVNPNMEHWQGIIACGLMDACVTSLAEVSASPPTLETVRQAVIQAFGEVMGLSLKMV